MTLQELRYLVAVAEHGSFIRAAEACHVGQPTLSIQLKKVEDFLGVTLFERNKHRLIPTPIGELIIEQARSALEVVARIKELARFGLDPMSGPLRVGVIPTLGPYLIPSPAAEDACRLSTTTSLSARGPDREPARAAAQRPAGRVAARAAGARRGP